MAFPSTILPQKHEIYVGSWVDITSYVQNRSGVSIRRGRSNENANTDPQQATISLNNRDGRFSPRNPESPYFGVLGRNTPYRCSLTGSVYLDPGQVAGATVGTAYVSTPDAATLDIVGDVDLRFDADLDSWAVTSDLVTKWVTTGNQRSYGLWMQDGYLKLSRSTDGTLAGTGTFTSTVAVPVMNGRQAVRATLDVNDGLGNRVATFYTAATIAGPWVQLGDATTTAGVIALYSSTAPLRILDNPDADLGLYSVAGRVLAAEVRDGIGGTVVANPDFTLQTAGAGSFADTAPVPKTWTLNGTTSLSDRDWRFWGEVSAWPQKWDITGTDIWTDVVASGVFRRLQQGDQPIDSSYTRSLKADASLVGYWPFEDGEDATVMGSALSRNRGMTIAGTPDLASVTSIPSTNPLPTMSLAYFGGNVQPYTSTNAVNMSMMMTLPAGGIANGIVIARLLTSGGIAQIDLQYATGGALYATFYNGAGTVLLTSAATAFALNGASFLVGVYAVQNGADVDVRVRTYELGATIIESSAIETIAGTTIRVAKRIVINPEKRMDDVGLGQVTVGTTQALPFDSGAQIRAMNGYPGETAGARLSRLCLEAGLSFFPRGNMVTTAALGVQRSGQSLVELLRQCSDADGGILYEPREGLGVAYRSRSSMNHQGATVTASYALNQMAELQPVEDDSGLANDMTVVRIGGASSRFTRTTGPLQIAAPPTGMGVYDSEVNLSLYDDAQTDDQAGWRLAQGTVNEPRYPGIDFDYASPSILASATLTAGLDALDIGDRVLITSPPTWGARESISQITQGYTEFLNNFERRVSVNCSPATVFDQVGVFSAAVVSSGGQSKYSSDGSTLAASYNSTDTSFSVATPSGPLWTTSASQHPREMIVAGEQVTVTATSGTTSPQTFTVTRSVNGVVKSQASGAAISLLKPAKYSFE